MTVFGTHYALYYDLLYRDKNYAWEADYIAALIRKYRPGAQSLLELGSGTGKHAELLAKKGYQVHGIERSETMLSIAKQREAKLQEAKQQDAKQQDAKQIEANSNEAKALQFTEGDIRSFQLNQSFDVAIALFHVVCYLNSNEDLLNTFANVSRHLKPGGIFLFDCWYGPAVLSDRPMVRVKRLEDDNLHVTRLSEPEMVANENVVDVRYQVWIRDKQTGQREEIKESHRMRYLFMPELRMMLAQCGLALEACYEFGTGKEPGNDTWNVLFVGRKR